MTGSITTVAINGTEHWVNRDGHRLHVWEKTGDKPPSVGKVTLLVHGGTYSGKTDFDIQVPDQNFPSWTIWLAKGMTRSPSPYGATANPIGPQTVSR